MSSLAILLTKPAHFQLARFSIPPHSHIKFIDTTLYQNLNRCKQRKVKFDISKESIKIIKNQEMVLRINIETLYHWLVAGNYGFCTHKMLSDCLKADT